MEKLKEIRNKIPFSGMIIFIAGVLLFLFPAQSGKGLCYIICSVLVVKGISQLIANYRGRVGSSPFPMESLWNALLIGLGLFIGLNSSIVISIVPFAFGIYFMTTSITSLHNSLLLKRMRYDGWKSSLLMSLLKVMLAIFILVDPFKTGMTLIRFMGGCLVYDSLTGFMGEVQISRARKEQEKARRDLRSMNLNSSRSTSVTEDTEYIPTVEAEFVDIEESIKDSDR